MAVASGVITWEALAAAIEAAGQYTTLEEAISAGVVIVGDQAVTGLAVVEGGAALSTSSTVLTALEIAKSSELAATGAKISTGGATLFKTASGFKLAGLMTLDVGMASAVCAPLAGVNLGANLYEANPRLWTKISEALLPFCYAENKIQAFVDFVKDPLTSKYSPIVTVPTAIIDALKSLFAEEVHFYDTYYKSKDGVNLVGADAMYVAETEWCALFAEDYTSVEGSGVTYADGTGEWGYTKGSVTLSSGSHSLRVSGWEGNLTNLGVHLTPNPYAWDVIMSIANDESVPTVDEPPTAGVSAPTAPVEPIIWPDTPIIVVPDPLGPDYQPIPVTPITPLPLPAPDPIPLLPEHVPDPTPDKPEEWPEEEPWPTVVPFPFQPTEPDPNWPEVMPWPLPSEEPEEWPATPEVPEQWPEEYPDDLPWPHSPDEWPEEVPWPDTAPEDWPEEVPWPDSPEDWPEEVPWPVPWPDDWPDDVPWPVPWPDEIPYPIPYPYPEPSPDPYPDPEKIEDPEKQVDPYIDPWPRPWKSPEPEPEPDPDPYRDPTQPEPKPEPKPDPVKPPDPYPVPPKGDPDPPIPPIIPLPFSSTTGLISVYHPTQSELLAFASWLWVTWQDATIEKIWNNPFDGVITLFELYCTPTDVGRKNIRSGFLDSGVSSETISRYTEINCGSIGVPEYFGNYLDYSPYSKCHMFLPFIGIVELNVDDIVGHGVNVTYRIDEYNGSCIAMITCAKSTEVNGISVDYSTIVYQFSGNCAVELPLAGGTQASIRAGMIEAAAWGIGSVIGGVMGGNSIGSIGQGLAYGAASAVHSVVSAKSSVQHSGSFGSSYGAMGGKKPYIIVTRPKEIQVPNYNKLYGYQSHKMVRVGDCEGYLRCREVHVISPTASNDEKALIEQLLKSGVYIS